VQLLVLAGATFVTAGVTLSGVLGLTTVTGEKAQRLVGSLRTIGLHESAYWVSWYTAFVPLLIAMALLAALVGQGTGIALFTNANYGIHMLGFLLLGSATLAQSLCCASVQRSPRWVNVTTFCLFALAVSMTTVFAAAALYTFVYLPSIPVIIPLLIGWMPVFHYGKFMTSIITYIYFAPPPSSTQQQQQQQQAAAAWRGGDSLWEVVVNGTLQDSRPGSWARQFSALQPVASAPVFGWSQLAERPAAITVMVDGFPQQWQDVAPSFNLWMLVVLTVGYLLLAWYFAQIATADLGARQPFYFPFSPYYWGAVKPPTTSQDGDTLALVQRLSRSEGSVRIHKLSKSYAKQTVSMRRVAARVASCIPPSPLPLPLPTSCVCVCVQALKEVSLVLPPGQCTALLGQVRRLDARG